MELLVMLLIYGSGVAVLVAGAVVFYVFAVSSRRSYRCPQCGERCRTEYLDARRCGHCGAELRRED